MKKNIILTAAIVMVLSSCGLQKGGSIRQDFSDFGQNLRMIVSSKGIKAEKNITNKDIASSEYAYVVGGFYGRNEWLHVSKNFDDSWEDDEVVELPFYHYYIDGSDRIKYDYNLYKIKPGRYTLVTFSSTPENNLTYRSIDPDREENDKIRQTDSVYASFEAKAGEVVYVGDFQVTGLNTMIITDNEDMVIEYLRENYKNLDNPQRLVKKRLAKKGKHFRE